MGLAVPMPLGWNPTAQCNDKAAHERAKWLQDNKGLGKQEAQAQVMREYPCPGLGWAPAALAWNPRAICDGKTAEERSQWLQKEKFMTKEASQYQVMQEFPAVLPMGEFVGIRGAAMVPEWNPNAQCEGNRAEERSLWLQKEKGFEESQARRRVMGENPSQFRWRPGTVKDNFGFGTEGYKAHPVPVHSCGWQPQADCGGDKAVNRANWLHDNEGLTQDAARHRVISDFPAKFDLSEVFNSLSLHPSWNEDALCDKQKAGDRAKWLQENKGMSAVAARQQIMDEFPKQFGGPGPFWKPDAMCDGIKAQDRATWLQQNKGMDVDTARRSVLIEHPNAFK